MYTWTNWWPRELIGPDFARGVAIMCYAIAPNPRHLVQAALPSVPEYHPGQQIDGQVLVPTQQYEEVLGVAWASKVGSVC